MHGISTIRRLNNAKVAEYNGTEKAMKIRIASLETILRSIKSHLEHTVRVTDASTLGNPATQVVVMDRELSNLLTEAENLLGDN